MLFPLFDHNPTKRFPILTILLIVANVAVFLHCQALTQSDLRDLMVTRGFVPKRFSHLNEPKPVEIIVTDHKQQRFGYQLPVDTASVYGTLFSMMFLHGGWVHLITNMWMLWVFGNNIEDRLGHITYIGFYVMGGLSAIFAQWIIDPESMRPVIGASGAVWAVLGGYAVTYPWARVKSLVFILLLEVPALLVIAFFFCLDLIMAISGIAGAQQHAVAHWAHLGGCAAGVTLMPLLAFGASPPDADWRSEGEALLVVDQPMK